jgi:hypothetical protein
MDDIIVRGETTMSAADVRVPRNALGGKVVRSREGAEQSQLSLQDQGTG